MHGLGFEVWSPSRSKNWVKNSSNNWHHISNPSTDMKKKNMHRHVHTQSHTYLKKKKKTFEEQLKNCNLPIFQPSKVEITYCWHQRIDLLKATWNELWDLWQLFVRYKFTKLYTHPRITNNYYFLTSECLPEDTISSMSIVKPTVTILHQYLTSQDHFSYLTV